MKSIIQLKLKENERRALLDFKLNVLQKYPDFKIILYGSKARGEDTEFSDIDLLVLANCEIHRDLKKEISWIKYEIELKHDVVIGMIIENRIFWESPLANAMPFHWSVDREGVLV